eukprot:scaffold4372_cov397-Prasinococcus_capsulatus_cf.AAC.11
MPAVSWSLPTLTAWRVRHRIRFPERYVIPATAPTDVMQCHATCNHDQDVWASSAIPWLCISGPVQEGRLGELGVTHLLILHSKQGM